MDEERKKAVAYEYLCHLEEAKVIYKNQFLLFVTPVFSNEHCFLFLELDQRLHQAAFTSINGT